MRISYNSLKTLLPDLPSVSVLVDRLVQTGTEVESVATLGDVYKNVVVGHIISKEPHPNSDHMSVCMVDVGDVASDSGGNPRLLQIVCGATNFKQDDKVVVACEGAVFGDFKIKKSKLRGIMSEGMNCSEKELGLKDESEGIMILPSDAPVGMSFGEYLKLSDTILDCEITPNRPDCLSVLGFAREVSAIFDIDMVEPVQELVQDQTHTCADELEVVVEDCALCTRYMAGVVHNIEVKPSPDWLKKELESFGVKPKNNVVDITNYVMFLTGQPLHAFDKSKLGKQNAKTKLTVRRAFENEEITTLDGQTFTLSSEHVVIADGANKPQALAGVMGAKSSEVDETTRDVVLECASFDSGCVSKTSRSLNLMSEASIRFERKVDAKNLNRALEHALALLAKVCSGTVVSVPVDWYPEPVAEKTLTLRPKRVDELVGTTIDRSFMVERLERLGCKVVEHDEQLLVTPPSFRPDLEREIDLIEEIVRIWGMDRVPASIPAAKNHAGGLTTHQKQLRSIARSLQASGLHETLSYCFVDAADLEALLIDESTWPNPVEIINPLVSDQSVMRRMLLPGLLRSVAYNLAHGNSNVALYEMGRVFFNAPDAQSPQEPTRVAGVLCGSWAEPAWNQQYSAFDFFDAKGVVESLLQVLRIEKVAFKPIKPEKYPWLTPGQAAEVCVKKQVIGWVGAVHPLALNHFEIENDVMAFELDVQMLLELSQTLKTYSEIPAVPGIVVDLALVVDEDMSYEMVLQRLKSAGGKLLESVELFDVYRDPVRVGEHKKSLAFSLVYRDPVKTLTADVVEKTHAKLIEKICKACKGEVRA